MFSKLFINGLFIDWEKIPEESYLRRIEALRGLSELEFRRPVTFFTGENGVGKSTLLEAMAVSCGFNPEGGTKNYAFSTYDSHSELHEAMRLSRGISKAKRGYFLRAESFYNVATKEEEYSREPGGVPQDFHRMSHGESFMKLMNGQFRGNGLYLLDEPEAALSPQRQMAMLVVMDNCIKEGSQFIIVTHSPVLLAFPGAEILKFESAGIAPCAYEDTDSYKITSLFINDRERILRRLLP